MPPSIIVSPFGVKADALPGGTHYILNDKVKLSPLSDEHKARIVEYLDTLNEESLSKRVRQRPAFTIPYSEIAVLKALSNTDERADFSLQMHRFSLEYFSGARAPMVAFTFDGTSIISHALDPMDLRIREQDEIELAAGSWDKHAAYLEFLYAGIQRAPLARLAMTRICRAYRQGPTSDGIIDLAIGLECLVIAQIEVKFQFSLYHSLINTATLEERQSVFSLLQELYDVRSTTVHGGELTASTKRKLKKVQDNWAALIQIARVNLTYYINYCKDNEAKSWQEHLRSLAMGLARQG